MLLSRELPSLPGGDVEFELARNDVLTVSECFMPAGNYARHRHADWSLNFFVSGTLVETWDGGTRRVQPGTAVVLPPGWRHSLQVDAPLVHTLHVRWQATRAGIGANQLGYAGSAAVARVLGRVFRALPAGGAAQHAGLEATLQELLTAIGHDLRRSRHAPACLWGALAGLADAHDDLADLTALAQRLDTTRRKAVALFQRHLGGSPAELARIRRVLRGLTLLRATQRPLAQVARDAGFADQAHMTRAMNRYLGATPARFRD